MDRRGEIVQLEPRSLARAQLARQVRVDQRVLFVGDAVQRVRVFEIGHFDRGVLIVAGGAEQVASFEAHRPVMHVRTHRSS